MKNFKAGDLVRYLFQDAAEDAEGIGIVVKDDPSGWFWIYAGKLVPFRTLYLQFYQLMKEKSNFSMAKLE